MTKQPDNTTTLWALSVLSRYAPAPLVDTEDYHVAVFRRQCERDAQLRELMAERDEEAERAMGGQDFDTWSELQMGAGDDRR